MDRLPTLDIGRFAKPGANRSAFLAEFREAARDIGFFYAIGHGVPAALIANVLAATRNFFALPEAEKLRVEMIHSPHFRGYNRPGWERTRGKPDWREQFDLAAERPALPRDANLPPWSRLQGPNLWPEALPEFGSAMLR